MDLPLVGLIIHYNLPQNIENYIHRSRRTARIYNEGISIAFAGPGDTKSLIAIEKLLGKKINKYNVDVEKVRQVEEVVGLSSEIAEKESINMGSGKDNSWTDKPAEAIGHDTNDHQGQVGKKHIKI